MDLPVKDETYDWTMKGNRNTGEVLTRLSPPVSMSKLLTDSTMQNGTNLAQNADLSLS